MKTIDNLLTSTRLRQWVILERAQSVRVKKCIKVKKLTKSKAQLVREPMMAFLPNICEKMCERPKVCEKERKRKKGRDKRAIVDKNDN